MKTKLITLFLLLLYPAFSPTAGATVTTNAWADTAAGTFKWETASDWSLGVPPSVAPSSIMITNVSVPMPHQNRQKTVEIDSTTASSFPGTMTISNLTVGAPTFNQNTLLVNNTGSIALQILNNFTISSHGVVTVNNAILQLDGIISPPSTAAITIDGTMLMNNCTVITTNLNVFIGTDAGGKVTVNDGTSWLIGHGMLLGDVNNATSSGTLTLNGGTIQRPSAPPPGQPIVFAVGQEGEGIKLPGSGPCALWVTGGLLDLPGLIWVAQSSQMTVSNGTWLGTGVLVSQGTITIAGGTNDLESPDPGITGLRIGYTSPVTGTVWVTGGNLSVGQTLPQTNILILGDAGGIGQMTVSNGTAQLGLINGFFGNMYIGRASGSQGTLTIAGGSITLSAALVGVGQQCLGTVWVTGGLLNIPNGLTLVGDQGGIGEIVVSNGTMQINSLDLGMGIGIGELTVAGGTSSIYSNLLLGPIDCSGGGGLFVSGGSLYVTNAAHNSTLEANNGNLIVSAGWLVTDDAVITNRCSMSVIVSGSGSTWSNNFGVIIGDGINGNGMVVSNGAAFVTGNIVVGKSAQGQGTLTIASGGTTTVSSNLTIGSSSCTGTGLVVVSGGSLFVTNASHTAVLDLESGTFTLNSGTVIVDTIMMTNPCAHFVRSGGTLLYANAIPDPNGDIDGDGIPNGYELAHGLDPFNSADANLDNDGDGFSNLQEFLAGTDPNDKNSTPFHAATVGQQGSNIVLTWTTLGGTTNQVQVTGGTGAGGYATNGFANLGSQMFIGGSGNVTTNYLDIGGATNKPARYYRVRLIP